MRRISITLCMAAWAVKLLAGAPGMSAPSLTVGRNLQMYAAVQLSEAAPAGGLRIVLRSDDPKRLLVSDNVDKPGSPSIALTVRPRALASSEFFLQALDDEGSVTYTASAPGMEDVRGTVTLAPSAIVIMGPFRLPSFPTTPRSDPSKISLYTAALDSSMKVLAGQPIAAGGRVEVEIVNSNPEAGNIGQSRLIFTGGMSDAATYFKPAAEGRTTLRPVPPPGFRTPAEFATVIASVEKPGLAVGDDIILGKDLQGPGILCLGESPGPEGLNVTLTSSDPTKLLLSVSPDQVGVGSITLTMKKGELSTRYYLQALSDTGTVTFKATAPGFRSRIGQVILSQSGVIVAYGRYGPPDEAAVLSNSAEHDDRRFYTSLAQAKEHPVYLVVWSVYLDPATGRAADMTVQDLRPGVSATVDLRSSNPAIGIVETPVTIKSGSNHVAFRFTPLSRGETVVSVSKPQGFSAPKNATAVPAIVLD